MPQSTMGSPGTMIRSVTKSDSADISTQTIQGVKYYPRAILVMHDGSAVSNIALIGINDGDTSTILLKVPAGSVIPLQTKKVLSTGTTATNIYAIY